MLELNPESLQHWAKELGMVSVQMFARNRATQIPGHHLVLLDGERASFALSIVTLDDRFDPDQSLGWSWSSNVRHSVTIDARRSTLAARRWDAPEQLDELAEVSVRALARLVEKFESLGPPLATTVIERALNAFRVIRLAAEERGGNNLDVILAFNLLLIWTEASRRNLLNGRHDQNSNLSQALDALAHRGLWHVDANQFSPAMRSFPITEMTDILLEGEAGERYALDADLLIRHASGKLFQEASIQLERQPVGQHRLFVDVPNLAPKPRGAPKRDAHFTPPSLARLLVQRALAESALDGCDTERTILDPACGSGVFLLEAVREMSGSPARVDLRGVDNSSVAVAMARFTLDRTVAETEHGTVDVKIEEGDSLSSADWGEPDLIVMNPPFSSWRVMTPAARDAVKSALGDLYLGHSDASVAFVAKAIKALKPGGALAAVVPAAMLESKSAAGLRHFIQSNPEYSVRLVGRFRGYGYFHRATVEPAFIVVSRVQRDSRGSTTFVVAEPGHEEQAIRGIRKGAPSARSGSYEIFTGRIASTQDSWMPRPPRETRLVDALRSNVGETVGSLFDTWLGIRTGANEVFLIDDAQFARFCRVEAEKKHFRPVADAISDAQIRRGKHVFYPYGDDNRRLLNTEREVAAAVPAYYRERLKPNEATLASRKSLRNRRWWELVEPRVHWLAVRNRKIVLPAFGRAGAFAYDESGEFAVVQGTAWFWKRGEENLGELAWAYVALLNSAAFECLLSHFCPRVGGGQYELYRKFTEQIPLPDLSCADARKVGKLARIGRSLGAGKQVSILALDELASELYGVVDFNEFHRAFRLTDGPCLRRLLAELASAWNKGSAHHSAISQMLLHPAYQRILSFGAAAIPFIFTRLQQGEGRWFNALQAITGENPVPAGRRGSLKTAIDEWLRWGRDHGYLA